MAEQCESLAGAARVWRSLALGDGDAADLTDEALRKAFDSIDADLSGTIEEGELTAAIKAANPSATDEIIKKLIEHADTDGDGTIDFEEYKTIMRMGA